MNVPVPPNEPLPGPTGEVNELSLHGRGTFLCISPWNFPLAIFTGQVVAALVSGNCVIAKPAEQTPLIAARAVQLMLEAGVPGDVIHLLPGDGATVGGALVRDSRITGVAFTGSTATAKLINRQLADRDGPIAPLIAETGGLNAMIVDATALPEQVVDDTITSAFRSAGQRCSALRVMFLQEDIADGVIAMLTGAMKELVIGDPAALSTDIGPVIDLEARQRLEQHALRMKREASPIAVCELDPGLSRGYFFPPQVYELRDLSQLPEEVFGPVLHVIRYRGSDIGDVIRQINATGYGLTLGVHSRIDGFARDIFRRSRVGNTYINRNMVGAVVGVNPFGGQGLSGTGPKAGGPHYLLRFATEKTRTDNVVAKGGNTQFKARPDEAQALSDLAMRSKAHWGYPADFMEACREELTVSPEAIAAERFVYRVAEVENALVGFYCLERLSRAGVELDALFVEPACIGSGTGGRLLRHALRAAVGLGARSLFVQSDPGAEAFYVAMGAERIGSSPSASIPGRELPLLRFELVTAHDRPA